MKSLAGKSVVVMGAGGGIGRALSEAFAREGASVAAVDVNEGEARKTADILCRQGFDCLALCADATDRVAVERVADEVISRFGKVDVLMNCVGIGAGGRLENFDLEDWERTVNINLWGTLVPIYAFLPHMIERRQGSIATISSASGVLASPFTAPYNTTKFALVGLGDSMRSELSGYGIGVTTICPSAIRTRFMENSLVRLENGFDAKLYKYLLKMWESAIEPEKAAEVVVKAIKRNKPMVVIGREIKLLYLLKRIAPSVYYSILDLWGKIMVKAAERRSAAFDD